MGENQKPVKFDQVDTWAVTAEVKETPKEDQKTEQNVEDKKEELKVEDKKVEEKPVEKPVEKPIEENMAGAILKSIARPAYALSLTNNLQQVNEEKEKLL